MGSILIRCRCLDDVDDEVRDRAALYLKVFERKSLVQAYVKEGKDISATQGGTGA